MAKLVPATPWRCALSLSLSHEPFCFVGFSEVFVLEKGRHEEEDSLSSTLVCLLEIFGEMLLWVACSSRLF